MLLPPPHHHPLRLTIYTNVTFISFYAMFIHLFLFCLISLLALTNWSRFGTKAAEILLKGKLKTGDGVGGRQQKKTEWGNKRRVCDAKLFLPTDRLLLQKTWKSHDKTRELKHSGPQSTNVWCYSKPHQYLALLRSCRRARQTQITIINSPPVS